MPRRCPSSWCPAAACALLAFACVVPADGRDDPKVPAGAPDFNRDVRPILAGKCFKCHGPDEKQRQAGLSAYPAHQTDQDPHSQEGSKQKIRKE